MKFVVTGGRGFIGSHFVEEALARGHKVIDIDSMTYCSSHILPWDNHENYTFLKQDISEISHLPSCDVIFNFAAESHVDNSINDTSPFMKSNFLGVHNLLELVRGKREYDRPVFFQISTDEVYGDSLNIDFKEGDRLKPSNPYAASKAAAEMLVVSYGRTYGINYLITRSTNNYGERQYHEKLIPRAIDCIRNNKKIPLHGDGSYERDWLYVKDNVDAIFTIFESNCLNETFNIGTNQHLTNIEAVKKVLSWFGRQDNKLISFVDNRWGQDIKYAIDCTKLLKLGWTPKHSELFCWFDNAD